MCGQAFAAATLILAGLTWPHLVAQDSPADPAAAPAASPAAVPAAPAAVTPPPRLVVDWTEAEIARDLPELTGLHSEENPALLAKILQSTGENLDQMFQAFVDVASNEDIHEMRIGSDDTLEGDRRESFQLESTVVCDEVQLKVEEHRTDAAGGDVQQRSGAFLVTSGFLSVLRHFHPYYRAQSRFRYLGQQVVSGRDTDVLAFAQRPETARLRSRIGNAVVLLQGFVWIDAKTARVIRVRTELQAPVAAISLRQLTTDVRFTVVNFKDVDRGLWVPAKVSVSAEWGDGSYYTVHRYSRYRLSQEDERAQAEQPAAEPEPLERVLESLPLIHGGREAEAIAAIREALRMDPNLAGAHYYLGLALGRTNNLEGAIAEFRKELALRPDSPKVHNSLGAALFTRGDASGAAAEFRECARLEPGDPAPHFNLAGALARLGDKQGALQQYQMASTLAPDNATFRAGLESLSRSLHAPASKPLATPTAGAAANGNIQVNVRQVLVPVVITDAGGRHVAGLKQSDFKVFEDGVEQDISAFSVQTAGTAPAAPPALAAERKPEAPAPDPPQRTFLICLDALHSSFQNLSGIRDALARLFTDERDADAQYALISLGRSPAVIQDLTRDSAAVLRAIQGGKLQAALAGSGKSNQMALLDRLRGELNEYRGECGVPAPLVQGLPPPGLCGSREYPLTLQANALAQEERTITAGFLQQLRALVEQLGRTPTRRVLILVSDGFQLVPGRDVFALMATYFPDRPEWTMRRIEGMQFQFLPILQLAAKRNVVIYTVDSRGLHTGGAVTDVSIMGVPGNLAADVQRETTNAVLDSGAALAELAASTGGVYFQNSNDLLTAMKRAVADGRDYYVLAYVPRNANLDGKFRAIRVQVKDSKLAVRAKPGYWATEP